MPRRRGILPWPVAILAAAVAVLAVACSGDTSEPTTPTATPTATSTPTSTSTPPPTQPPEEVVPEFATVLPDWIEGLTARTDSHQGAPYRFFASWPHIEGYPRLADTLHELIEAERTPFAAQVGEPIERRVVLPELNISFEFLVASGDVIGVRLREYAFYGAGGADRSTTVWFDLARDEVVPAAALVRDLDELASLVRDALRRDRPDLSIPELFEEGTAPTAANYESIGFTAEGDLLVEFDEYQVGPGSSGAPRVLIPSATAEGLLSDFGARARREVLSPSGELRLPPPPPEPTPAPPTATPTATPTMTPPTATPTPAPTETPPPPSLPAPPPATGSPSTGRVDCAVTACVALTFDDGPAAPTARLLAILADYDARATFFVLGVNATYRADTLAAIAAGGHEIGNHTYDHRDLTKLSTEQMLEQVNTTASAVQRATGQRPALLRPPYGAFDERVARSLELPVILWSVDPRDWADHDAAVVADRVTSRAQRGSIVLLHDIHDTTVDAVPAILEDFQRRGFTVVTVSELYGGNLVAGQAYRSR